MGMWDRKSVASLCAAALAEAPEGQPALKRELTALHLTMMAVGGTIGAGIFVITGVAAAQYAGPAVVLSFAFAGLACLCTAFCYAELASMIPLAGGAYTYTYATLGQAIAWVIGWCLTLEYMIAGSTVAVGWSGYFVNFMERLGFPLPPLWSSAPITLDANHHLTASGSLFNLPAALLVAAVVGLILFGVRRSARANNVLVAIKVGVILLVIVFGAGHVDTANWTPFIPPRNEAGQFGWGGVFTGAGAIFFAYVGFDGVATSAQEARNPQRDMSRGLLAGLLICTALYIGMSLVVTGLSHYTTLNVPNPVIVAVDAAGPGLAWLAPIVNVGAIIGLGSVVLIAFYCQTRLFYAMACDGLLPGFFRKVHAGYHTPWGATLAVGVICVPIAGLFPVSVLGELVSMGTLLSFAIVCFAVIILRRTEPDAARGFRAPLVPVVPLVGAAACLYLMAALPAGTWLRLAIWLALGMAIYFLYGLRNSARMEAAQAAA